MVIIGQAPGLVGVTVLLFYNPYQRHHGTKSVERTPPPGCRVQWHIYPPSSSDVSVFLY